MKTYKILLLSNNKFRNIYFDKFLTKHDYNVVIEEAFAEINLIKLISPEIIILSLSVDNNTYDFCKILRGNMELKKIPIIILTNDFVSEKQIDLQYIYYLNIPFKDYELLELLGKITKNKKKILLADDSKIIHHRVGNILKENGFEVIDAYDGEEGLQKTFKEKPDLIITDVEMPKKNGFEFCKEIKTNPESQHIPVIIVSSLGKEVSMEEGFEAGANDYLVKPIVPEELISRINSIFAALEIRGREKILVVDDSITILNFIKQGLMQQGFQVLTAVNGEEGYEKTLNEKPALIISDLTMPKVSGIELTEYLKENEETKNIPIIIITSHDSRAEKVNLLKKGVIACLSKPFTIEKLVVMVERVLAEKRLNIEKEAMKHYMSEAAVDAVQQITHKEDYNELQASEAFLTIFFSDIVGFTTICEKLKPKEVVELLNEYFDLMTGILKKNNAVIDKFIGDAILAFYYNEDDNKSAPYKAVKTALEMLQALKEFNIDKENTINIRIGISAGNVILGDIGSKLHRKDYTVIGDNVNTAQRLQSAAEPGTALICETIYNFIKDKVKVVELAPLSLKGKKKMVNAYQVIELKD